LLYIWDLHDWHPNQPRADKTCNSKSIPKPQTEHIKTRPLSRYRSRLHASSLGSKVYARCCFWAEKIFLSSGSSDAAFLQCLPCCGDFETDPVRTNRISNSITNELSNLQRCKKRVGMERQSKPGAWEFAP